MDDKKTRSGLDALFNPRSVAVIGATEDPTRIGGRPLCYLKKSGFQGDIWPVNPRRDRVQGIEARPNIAEVPGAVDVAIVAVPAANTVPTIEDCAARGVGAAVVFTSGFAETDAVGAARQRRMGEIARASGMRILGPNCLGVYNAATGFFATFTTTLDIYRPEPGPVAIVSQSGAYGSHLGLLARRRRIGVGLWVTTGNECDVTVPECIAWMATHPEIRVVAAYAEGMRDGDALLSSLDAVRASGKCVFFTKTGRTKVGAEAARSHTAALAGEDTVFDSMLAQHGVVRTDSTEEMLDAAYAASFGALPSNRRVGLMTISGGAGVMMADEATVQGLEVSPMPQAAQRRLKEKLSFCTPRNPVDITAQVFNAPHLVGAFLDAMLDEGDYAAIVIFFTYVASVEFMAKPTLTAIARARERHPDRPILMAMVGSDEAVAPYEALNVPVFEDPVRAVRTVSALARVREGLARQPYARTDAAAQAPGNLYTGGRLDEYEAMNLLASWGIPVVGARAASNVEEATRAVGSFGSPVAMKILSPDIEHKSEAGGVTLGITSERAAAEHDALVARARAYDAGAEIRGTLVAPMVSGVECILGMRRDPVFGPVVMVGSGGVLAEVLDDVSFRRAPIDEAEATRMIGELTGGRVLEGIRGRPRCDIAALAAAVAALSRFAVAHAETVDSVDVNPFVVLPAGEGGLAVDALIVGRTPT
ncbi:MAG: acetate--CoA ligase family protein [Thiotrichales bacterium]|nr:acetate--CoA ligase family protein [Thiotrichales bacterium]